MIVWIFSLIYINIVWKSEEKRREIINMILGTQLPEWKQIIGRNKGNKEEVFFGKEDVYFLSKSCMSINLIINAYRKVKDQDRVFIWLPDYFCNQTISSFKEEWMEISYYPIDENLDPRWSVIREQSKKQRLDIFIFTHYFGKYHSSICNAKEICKMKGGILVEDCAHILYATGKVGKSGDFVLYSPHKQIPICDGAVLHCNKKDSNAAICNEMSKMYQSLKRAQSEDFWYIKKGIQKIIPIHRALTYYPGVHIGDVIEDFCEPKRISSEAYNILCGYTYEKFKRIAYIRRANVTTMNFIMKSLFPDIVPLIDATTDVPYLAVYSLEKYLDKKLITDELLKRDFTLLFWPDIPYDLEEDKEHAVAFALSENVIALPIHQGITPQKLIEKFYINFGQKRNKGRLFILQKLYLSLGEDLFKKVNNKNCEFKNRNIISNKTEVLRIEWTNDREKYQKVYHQVVFSNIPQDWDYGAIKERTEGWIAKRAIIKNGNNMEMGIVQILIKCKWGIKLVIRVNRGPLFLEEYDIPENHMKAMELVRSQFRLPVIYATQLEASSENLILLTRYKWKHWNIFGFGSGKINLYNKTEELLRKELDSKWRNQLISAEKKQVKIKFDFSKFMKILDIYEESQREKNFKGISRDILLLLKKASKLEILYIEIEEEIIAFDIFYVNDNFGLYLVGWNGPLGRKMYANNLLLYTEVVHLLERGIHWMELGGIDYIETEENARFKDGMKPKHYQLSGEFIKF